ncbi:MAG: phosphoribosylglycinamide formyltransferase, partial [Pseudomonadota bacterium]
MRALLAAMAEGRLAAVPALVLSNDPEAAGLAAAEAAGVAVQAIDHRGFRGEREAFDAAVHEALLAAGTDVVACAGFMRIMTARLTEPWAGRMLNIHPSLLPAFRGLDTHARALAAGCAIHGCTVHEVVADLDAGPILAQAAVPVRPGDTADRLAARVLEVEHRLYPEARRLGIGEEGGQRLR